MAESTGLQPREKSGTLIKPTGDRAARKRLLAVRHGDPASEVSEEQASPLQRRAAVRPVPDSATGPAPRAAESRFAHDLSQTPTHTAVPRARPGIQGQRISRQMAPIGVRPGAGKGVIQLFQLGNYEIDHEPDSNRVTIEDTEGGSGIEATIGGPNLLEVHRVNVSIGDHAFNLDFEEGEYSYGYDEFEVSRSTNDAGQTIYSITADIAGLLPLVGLVQQAVERLGGMAPEVSIDATFSFSFVEDEGVFRPWQESFHLGISVSREIELWDWQLARGIAEGETYCVTVHSSGGTVTECGASARAQVSILGGEEVGPSVETQARAGAAPDNHNPGALARWWALGRFIVSRVLSIGDGQVRVNREAAVREHSTPEGLNAAYYSEYTQRLADYNGLYRSEEGDTPVAALQAGSAGVRLVDGGRAPDPWHVSSQVWSLVSGAQQADWPRTVGAAREQYEALGTRASEFSEGAEEEGE